MIVPVSDEGKTVPGAGRKFLRNGAAVSGTTDQFFSASEDHRFDGIFRTAEDGFPYCSRQRFRVSCRDVLRFTFPHRIGMYRAGNGGMDDPHTPDDIRISGSRLFLQMPVFRLIDMFLRVFDLIPYQEQS